MRRIVFLCCWLVASCEGAGQADVDALKKQVGELQTKVTDLQGKVSSLESQLQSTSALTNANASSVALHQLTIDDAAPLLALMQVSAGDIVIEGANLRIHSGAGATDGAVNGKGNLIIGYDEQNTTTDAQKTGSHNLVVGPGHTYVSYGGLVAGIENSVTAEYGSVSGGRLNVAGGIQSSVGAGLRNSATGTNSSVCGGEQGVASGRGSAVSGGLSNTASGDFATASGGSNLTASADASHVP